MHECSVTILLAPLVFSAGCQNHSEAPASSAATQPRTFSSPDAAAKALYDAAKLGDTNLISPLFSPDAKDYLLTGDNDEDKAALNAFVSDYDRMHRWGKLDNGGQVLSVGIENYPFPFPLVKNSGGQWYFDSTEAKKECLARQLGDNELTVVDVLNAMADAQSQYFLKPQLGSKMKQYARKFVSSEGTHDGYKSGTADTPAPFHGYFYWKPGPGEPDSPLGPLAARASAEGRRDPAFSPAPLLARVIPRAPLPIDTNDMSHHH